MNMRTIRIAAVALALAALSGPALAQMGGMGHRGGGNGVGPDMARGDGRVLVAPDGKAILVKRTTTSSGSTTTTTVELVAVGTSGTVAWTFTPPADIGQIALPSGLVVLNAVTPGSSAASATSQLVALNLSSGAHAWSLAVDGMVHDLQVTPTGLLGVVSKYAATTGTATQGAVSRSLVSISLSGSVAWTLALD